MKPIVRIIGKEGEYYFQNMRTRLIEGGPFDTWDEACSKLEETGMTHHAEQPDTPEERYGYVRTSDDKWAVIDKQYNATVNEFHSEAGAGLCCDNLNKPDAKDDGKAKRFNAGKPSMHYVLLFKRSLEAVVRVCEYGETKYDYRNWLKGGKPDREYFDSCLRHLFAAMAGEAYDPESGCMHVAHAAWNLLAFIDCNWTVDLTDPNHKRFKNIEEWEKALGRMKANTHMAEGYVQETVDDGGEKENYTMEALERAVKNR